MIRAAFYRNAQGRLYGFEIHSHGDSRVCAAVSAMALNAANSIELLTDCALTYDCDDKGRLELNLPGVQAGEDGHDGRLLLESLLLGLRGIEAEHGGQIRVTDTDMDM